MTIGGDDELVTTDASTVTVQTYIRRIAQAITPVERIACIYQYVLNAETLFEVVVSKFCHKSIVPMFMCRLSAVTQSYTMFASIETCIEGSCCKFLWRVNAWLEIDMWSRIMVMVMLHEYRRTTMMTVGEFTHNCKSSE